MTNYKTGLVLEGGGMRGLYTIGVLDYFMDHGIKVDYVIGVSAGACNGASYVSGQKGRSYRINTQYLKDKRYISLRNYIKTKSLFGMDFLFDTIPNRLDPYDYTGLFASECQFIVGVTDVYTGKPVYFTKRRYGSSCCGLEGFLIDSRVFTDCELSRRASTWMAGHRIRFLFEKLSKTGARE